LNNFNKQENRDSGRAATQGDAALIWKPPSREEFGDPCKAMEDRANFAKRLIQLD
jgi:hypothetical protein